MGDNEHGALGSNQPLERVMPEGDPDGPAAKDKKLEVLSVDAVLPYTTVRSDNDKNLEVLPIQPVRIVEEDIVYLREDLRR